MLPLIHLCLPSTKDWLVLAGGGFSLWHPPSAPKNRNLQHVEVLGRQLWLRELGAHRPGTGCSGAAEPRSAPSTAPEGPTAVPTSRFTSRFGFLRPNLVFLCLHQVFARQTGLISAPARPDSPNQRDVEGRCAAAHLLLPPKRGDKGCGHGGELCLEPSTSRTCPARLAAPKKRGL